MNDPMILCSSELKKFKGMIRINVFFLLLLTMGLGLSSCKLGDKENNQPESDETTGLPEGFDDFYKRFHRDSRTR